MIVLKLKIVRHEYKIDAPSEMFSIHCGMHRLVPLNSFFSLKDFAPVKLMPICQVQSASPMYAQLDCFYHSALDLT